MCAEKAFFRPYLASNFMSPRLPSHQDSEQRKRANIFNITQKESTHTLTNGRFYAKFAITSVLEAHAERRKQSRKEGETFSLNEIVQVP